jgi:TorA maturation chaperone TorD
VNQTPNQNLDWTTTLTGEILLFGLLAKIIYSDPDAAWLQPLVEGDVFTEVPLGSEEPETLQGLELLNRWAQAQNGQVSPISIENLKTETITLFIGPGRMPVPLWESVYFSDEQLMFQERTMSVRYWYRRFGLETERVNQEPDDHIGLELSFVAHLATLALQALEEKNQARFESLWRAQKDFMKDHLLQWGPTWARLVIKYARSDFYRGIGHLTLGSLLAVARLLELEIPAKVLQ